MSQKMSNLSVGAKIKFGALYSTPLIWLVADKNHAGYPANSVTFVAQNIIKIMAADAKEPSNSDGNRQSYGNNRWIWSNIRTWLNSPAATGAWYQQKHPTDQTPSSTSYVSNNPYSALAGFLNSFTANEQNALLNTTITVGKANVDTPVGTETDACKVFNLSCTEVGLSGDHVCGTILNLFNTASNRIAKPTQQAVSNSDYSSSSLNTASAWYYWLRDAYASDSYRVRFVYTDGSLNSIYAYGGDSGLRPAFNLSSDLLISDITDGDGCYTVIYNTAPTKPSSINVPSTVEGGKSLTVTWGASTDVDGNLSSYVLERSYNGGAFSSVYTGSALTFTETITFGQTTVAYRVKARDLVGAESGYATSATRTIINNRAPVISGSDTNLGTFAASAPSYAYTITDADADTVTVVEKLDGAAFRTYTAALGATNTMSITADQWRKMLNGTHTFVITATDPGGASATRTLTFTKNVTTVDFVTAIMPADAMPTKAMVSIQGGFPAGSVLKVEICNNAKDASPTWQDVTAKVTTGQKIFFSNTTKTASQWGVALRVNLSHGTATTTCYITSIGGNFA